MPTAALQAAAALLNGVPCTFQLTLPGFAALSCRAEAGNRAGLIRRQMANMLVRFIRHDG